MVRSRSAASFTLLALGFLAYLPVLRLAGFIWDDPQYITGNPLLRTLPGLLAIWVHPLSTPQYYPIVHTTFWIEYHLVGLHPFLYHLDNLLLHLAAAFLLWRVLERLQIPMSFLIAAFFALHPAQVESVAWVTERKNVLSTVFYLLALNTYIHFAGADFSSASRPLRTWLFAFALVIAALLSKSVTCSLPAAILLLVYWKQGWIRWRDLGPLLPFFAVGLVMAFFTGYLEREHVGAAGHEWDFSFLERCVIAGRGLWFYALKLVWPYPLTFIYPRWNIHPLANYWLFAFPASAIAVVAALFPLRRKIGRGPLVAVLFFAGTLLPALGFINLFPMRYSFVADHFQYLACVGLLALLANGISLAAGKYTPAVTGFVLVALATLTFLQGPIYQNQETLFSNVIRRNPTSWMAWGTLGDVFAERSNQPDVAPESQASLRAQARACYAKLYELAPAQPMSHWKWGIVQEYDGDLSAAREEFKQALKLEPDFSFARDSLGRLDIRLGDIAQGIAELRRTVESDPGYLQARLDYASALIQAGDFNAAREQCRAALQVDPRDSRAQELWTSLGGR